jgi:curved DNA-binding protein CbpA
MSDKDPYQVLGVPRSATADQIKSAYRELVKRHHPDLVSASTEKAAATEKLRLINEAYAVLGNAAKRRRYDESSIPKATPRRPAAARSRRRTAPPHRPVKPVAKPRKVPRLRFGLTKRAAAYCTGGAMVIGLLAYGSKTEPTLVPAWTLFEKLEFSASSGISAGGNAERGWVGLSQFASMSECAGVLREKVRADEREGSRAVFDEKNGAMAITVHVQKEQAPGGESGNAAAKRVRNLECRSTPRIAMESWFRRLLNRLSFG